MLFRSLGELPCRVRPRDDLGRAAQNCLRAAPPQIVVENLIRIVEIVENQIEATEIIAQIERKLRISGEEAGERSVFNRSDGVGVKSFIRDDRNMRVTEDLDSRLWMGSAQCFQRRQGQNEIAKRPAANDEDSFNNRGMRERLRSRHRQNRTHLCYASAQLFC